MHEIVERVFLGSLRDATDRRRLDAHRITSIVTCCTVLEMPTEARFRDITYCTVDLEDAGNEAISEHFEEAADFIAKVTRAGRAVLIHCRSGVSRSPTITIAYLMLKRGYHLQEAFLHVRARRGIICPNIGFMSQLCALECEVAKPVDPAVAFAKYPSFSDGVETAEDMSAAAYSDPELPAKPGGAATLASCSHHELSPQSSSDSSDERPAAGWRGTPLAEPPRRPASRHPRRLLPSLCMDKYFDWYIADASSRATVPDLEPRGKLPI